jgi:hypothetical protein
MALQGSGSISFSQIANEFGLPSGRNLGAYRISQSVGTLSNLPLDSGIPQSGSISFSSFYGKRLNMVTDLFSIPQNSSRRVARNRYNNNFVIVIGGFRSRPSSSSGTKVYINVNQRIGSKKGNIFNVALQTGSWDSNTELIMVVGPNGSLMGAGGNGGNGSTGKGGDAISGTSALGIQYTATIINQGLIFGGRGGGGGGGGGTSRNAVEIKEVVREDKNFLLQVEVVPVVGVSLQALEELVETTELLELLIQMVVLVEQSLVKDQVLVFPVQVVLEVY